METLKNPAERLQTVITLSRLKKGAFAHAVGVSPASISHIISPGGRHADISETLALKIMSAFPELALSLDWLLNGEEPAEEPATASATPGAGGQPGQGGQTGQGGQPGQSGQSVPGVTGGQNGQAVNVAQPVNAKPTTGSLFDDAALQAAAASARQTQANAQTNGPSSSHVHPHQQSAVPGAGQGYSPGAGSTAASQSSTSAAGGQYAQSQYAPASESLQHELGEALRTAPRYSVSTRPDYEAQPEVGEAYGEMSRRPREEAAPPTDGQRGAPSNLDVAQMIARQPVPIERVILFFADGTFCDFRPQATGGALPPRSGRPPEY